MIGDQCHSLESIDLSWLHNLNDETMTKIIQNNPHLTKIYVWGCNRLTECAFPPSITKKIQVVGKFFAN